MPSILDKVAKEIIKEMTNQQPPKPKPAPNPGPKPGPGPGPKPNPSMHPHPIPPAPQVAIAKISVPAYQKAIFLNSVVNEPFPKNSYSTAMSSLIKDIDLVALHRQLIDEELLTRPTANDILASYSSTDLKDLAKRKDVKTTGTKEELVARLVASLSADEIMSIVKRNPILVLSTKGAKYIDKYGEYVYIQKKKAKYNINVEDYYEFSKAYPDKGTFEIAKLVIKEKAKDCKHDLMKTANLELNKAEILEDEMLETGKNKKKDIINAKMKYLYYSLNDSDEINAILKAMEEGKEVQMPRIQPVNYFTNNAIKVLKEVSQEGINYDFNNLPEERSLPYCICPREMVMRIVMDVSRMPNCNLERYNMAIEQSKRDLIGHIMHRPPRRK